MLSWCIGIYKHVGGLIHVTHQSIGRSRELVGGFRLVGSNRQLDSLPNRRGAATTAIQIDARLSME